MPKFGEWHEAAEGIIRKIFAPGDRIMSMMLEFQTGAVGPAHAHPHEQITFVISGKLRLTVGGAVHEIAAGEQLVVPGGAMHEVQALERSVVLETFTPLREDLLAAVEDA